VGTRDEETYDDKNDAQSYILNLFAVELLIDNKIDSYSILASSISLL